MAEPFVSRVCFFALLLSAPLAQCAAPVLTPDQRAFLPGIQLHPSCTTSQQSALKQALRDTRSQALQALDVASTTKPTDPLFSYFFGDSDRPYVQTLFQNITAMTDNLPSTPSVTLLCEDISNYCTSSDEYLLYLYRDPQNRQLASHPIVICPAFFKYPAQVDPCSKLGLETARGSNFGLNRASSLLHTLAYIPYMVGYSDPSIGVLRALGNTVLFCHAIASQGDDAKAFFKNATEAAMLRPRDNVFSYQHLGAWSYMRSRQQRACRQNYPLWNVLKDPSIRAGLKILQGYYVPPENEADLTEQDRNELRKLLFAKEGSEDWARPEPVQGTLQIMGPTETEEGDAVVLLRNITTEDIEAKAGIRQGLE